MSLKCPKFQEIRNLFIKKIFWTTINSITNRTKRKGIAKRTKMFISVRDYH
jgi:hypothetical protein